MKEYKKTISGIEKFLMSLIGNKKKVKEILSNVKDIQSLMVKINRPDFVDVYKLTELQSERLFSAIWLANSIKYLENISSGKLDTPTRVAEYVMEDMRYLKQEHFRIANIDTKSKIINIQEISIGSLDATLVHPRDVFRGAINVDANSIILIHNHPSGEVKPSREDINLTTRLQQAGKIMGIKVVDHIIIGDGVYFSFLEHNYM